MRLMLIVLLLLAHATAIRGQSAQPPAAGATPPTITVTGCVGGGANGEPFTLTAVSAASDIGRVPATGVEGAAGVATPPAAASPASERAQSQRTPGTAGTSGSLTITGYRLIGDDIASLLGKRVQVVGSVIPPTAPAGASVSASGATGTPSSASAVTMPELRVKSVEAIAGTCPQQ